MRNADASNVGQLLQGREGDAAICAARVARVGFCADHVQNVDHIHCVFHGQLSFPLFPLDDVNGKACATLDRHIPGFTVRTAMTLEKKEKFAYCRKILLRPTHKMIVEEV